MLREHLLDVDLERVRTVVGHYAKVGDDGGRLGTKPFDGRARGRMGRECKELRVMMVTYLGET